VERGTVAPWVGTDDAVRKATSPTELLGARVQFLPTRVDGAAALRCGNARYTATNVPAGGLFQGNLPAPASRAAAEIGLRESAIRGISLTCDRGLFEFHVADQTTVLVALDNVIWTLSRAAGALADSVSPAGVVQRLLEQHFASGLAFDSANVLSKSAFLSDSLRVSSLRYLAIPPSPDEAPVIDGDPFTYTQEYPTRFAVGAASVRGTLASVPVRFADAYSQRVLTYRLQRTAGTWRVADVRYADGSMLGMLRDERP
jgi:Protein of unknown function (DUF3828)